MVYNSDRDGIPFKKQKSKNVDQKAYPHSSIDPVYDHLSFRHSRTLADKSSTGVSGLTDVDSGKMTE